MIESVPFNRAAEETLIGALMLDPHAINDVADIVTRDGLHHRPFRHVFAMVQDRIAENLPVDMFLVEEEMDRQQPGVLKPGELLDLANNTPGVKNIRAYATLVADCFIRRRLLDAAVEVALVARHASTADEAVSDAARALIGITMPASSPMIGAKALMTATFKDLTARYEKPGISGMSTGLADLDELLGGGMQDGDLIVVAARPSMGKTAFALVLAEAVAKARGQVVVFSMEMSDVQIGHRLVAMQSGVNVQLLRTPKELPEADWTRVTEAMNAIREWNLHVDDSSSLNIDQLRARALRRHAKKKIRLLVVDYIQLMDLDSSDENRSTKIGEISRGLKKLAKELGCPVIALSQLNRKLEERTSKRPMMSDIRESGAIEQDADVIAFLYRDDYYNKASKDAGLCEVILGKNRSGPTETVKVKAELEYVRFVDLDPNYRLDTQPSNEEGIERYMPRSMRRTGKVKP